MTHRIGWCALVSGLLAQAGAYLAAALAGPAAPLATALAIYGIGATLAGLLVLGAVRGQRLSGAATLAAIALFVFPVAGFGAAALLPGDAATDALVLGLPARAAIIVYGIGVLPAFILPVAYLFDSPRDRS